MYPQASGLRCVQRSDVMNGALFRGQISSQCACRRVTVPSPSEKFLHLRFLWGNTPLSLHMGGNAGGFYSTTIQTTGTAKQLRPGLSSKTVQPNLKLTRNLPSGLSEPRTSMGEGHGCFTQYQSLSLARRRRSTIAASCLGRFDNRHLMFPERKIQ